jgi:predicted DCC family thiol-disulfide oxidoreductase YuxK
VAIEQTAPSNRVPAEGHTPTEAVTNAPPLTTGEPVMPAARIVFFDGVCSFCDGAVTWLRERDPEGRLYFASLQGETAAEFRAAYPNAFPASLDSIVYVDQSGETPRIEQRADAILRLCEELGGRWALLGNLRVIPSGLLDLAYRAFAANRYRLFGRLDACAIPSAAERERLLP